MAELLFQTLERVRTYKILKWNYRTPQLFHPYCLALQGYSCIQFDTIQCTTCKNRVEFSSQQPSQKQIDIDYGIIQKHIHSHHQDCLFSKMKPDEYNYKKVLSQSKLYLNMDLINQKFENLKKNEIFPIIDNEELWTIIGRAQKTEMIKKIMEKCQMSYQTYQISFILKIFGWNINPNKEQNKCKQIQCLFCGACTNLDEYATVNNNKQPQRSPQTNKRLFNPKDEHRYFCIWSYEMNGWQIWLQHLWDKMDEVKELFRKDNPEMVKKIRLNLDKYLEKFAAQTKEQFEKINKILDQCKVLTDGLENKDFEYNQQNFKRSRQRMHNFLEMIEEGIRVPLKKMKID